MKKTTPRAAFSDIYLGRAIAMVAADLPASLLDATTIQSRIVAPRVRRSLDRAVLLTWLSISSYEMAADLLARCDAPPVVQA